MNKNGILEEIIRIGASYEKEGNDIFIKFPKGTRKLGKQPYFQLGINIVFPQRHKYTINDIYGLEVWLQKST